MINHIRTLLLNKPTAAAGLDSGVPASEYVPETFMPVAITADLVPVRNALGLSDHSVFRLNHLLSGYMRLLHAPDMAGYTFKFDGRYTYDFSDTSALDAHLQYIEMTGFGADDPVRLAYKQYPHSSPAGKFDTAVSPATWTIRRSGDTRISIQIGGGDELQYVSLVFAGGRSQDIELVPGYLSIYILSEQPALQDNFTFSIKVYVPPVFSPTVTLAALGQADATYNLGAVLFVPWADYAEEIQALSDIWQYSVEHSCRLAAAILGYAYRCERLRRGILIPGRDNTLRRYVT